MPLLSVAEVDITPMLVDHYEECDHIRTYKLLVKDTEGECCYYIVLVKLIAIMCNSRLH